ncbi:MAG TPA: 16S rRNA (adenine(1518)-N(6)/adenine(1519)-N(6))-dimethyltransferase, partial [Ruminococcaceae bacterium]|nr:16S rRNA (adenine(1518)-N(6)/adenine(1519)-N(6))-dimethyltransferase [Oscillospiraceae bacterium]
ELALRAKKVVAVELDRRLLPVLSETLDGFGNVSVISGDILKIDLNELVAREFPDGKAVLCANLPYYITSP